MTRTSITAREREHARLLVKAFCERFGEWAPTYRLLAQHAALPLILTPELVSYLRNHFLRGQAPWVAESDLLLSDLCREVAYEQYVMDQAVRAVLIEELRRDPALGKARMAEVARLLIGYIRSLSRADKPLPAHELQAQQWAAMVYLDDKRESAARQIAAAFSGVLGPGGAGGVDRTELARLANLTQTLAPELGTYRELVSYGRNVARLLADVMGWTTAELDRTGRLDASVQVADVVLPILRELVPIQRVVSQVTEGPKYSDLVQALAAGNVCAFIGAGLSVGAGLQDWYDLIAELAKRIEYKLPPRSKASSDALIDATRAYADQRGLHSLISYLTDRLDTTGVQPTAAHRALARLPISLVFTANFDDLLERAFRDAGRRVEVVVKDSSIPFMRREPDTVKIVKLYGDLDQADTIVLARQQYESYFLQRPQMVKLLEIELARSDMLYLGCSGSDPYFKLVFGELLSRFGEMIPPGYAVMFDVTDDQRNELRRKQIRLVELPAGDRTASLAAWLEGLAPAADAEPVRPAALPTAAPQSDESTGDAEFRASHEQHDYGYSRRLWKWLEKFRFTEHPFAVWDADQERSVLPSLFVDRPYAVQLIGDPARPQSGILLGGQGAGKTATREMIAHECIAGRIRHRALPIRYTDFTAVLDNAAGDPAQVRLRDHIAAIVRAGLRVLADEVPPVFFDLLDEVHRGLLQGLAEFLADPLAHMKLGRLAPAAALRISWELLSPVELLYTFADLVVQLGASERRHYESLYILVDRVDETATGAAGALAMLKPLAVEGALLAMPRVAFKFFLPHDIGEQLIAATAVRRDRLIIESITWDDASLKSLLEMRLRHYSDGNVEHMTQLFTPAAASSVPRLWRDCGGSPRNLLRICGGMLRLHVERTDDVLLGTRDISAALTEFEQQLEAERTLPHVAARQAGAARAGQPPVQGLYLDESDHVWIDGHQLASPLSIQEFRLLKALYQVAPAIVSQEDLITAVWRGLDPAQDGALFGRDEQNVRKLIGRLRNHLEPGAAPGAWRFVRNARGRGYWLSLS